MNQQNNLNDNENAEALHLGEMLRSFVRASGHTGAWLAGKLHCDRTNIYKIFRRQSIDTDLLLRISVILRHDFFKDLSEQVCRSMHDPSVCSGTSGADQHPDILP